MGAACLLPEQAGVELFGGEGGLLAADICRPMPSHDPGVALVLANIRAQNCRLRRWN